MTLRTATAIPAFTTVDNFDIPTTASKYGWEKMAPNSARVFEGASSEEMDRIRRSVMSTSKNKKLRFATRTIPVGDSKFPKGALVIKYLGPKPGTTAQATAQGQPSEAPKGEGDETVHAAFEDAGEVQLEKTA